MVVDVHAGRGPRNGHFSICAEAQGGATVERQQEPLFEVGGSAAHHVVVAEPRKIGGQGRVARRPKHDIPASGAQGAPTPDERSQGIAVRRLVAGDDDPFVSAKRGCRVGEAHASSSGRTGGLSRSNCSMRLARSIDSSWMNRSTGVLRSESSSLTAA